MNNKILLNTTTEKEKKIIAEVMERAREKQKERRGDNIKLPSYSHKRGAI